MKVRTRFTQLVILAAATIVMIACRERAAPPPDMMNELIARQQNDRVWIAWQDSRYLLQTTIGPESSSRAFDVPADVAGALRKQAAERQRRTKFMSDDTAQLSPDGKWITYRKSDNQFVLSDSMGTTKREIVSQTHIWTPMYWSPDGRYLLYCEQSLPGDSRWRSMSGQIDMMVHRVQDGVEGRLTTFDELYPYYNFGWLIIPPNVGNLVK